MARSTNVFSFGYVFRPRCVSRGSTWIEICLMTARGEIEPSDELSIMAEDMVLDGAG